MDFELNAEQRLLQETVQKFALKEISPFVKKMDEEAAAKEQKTDAKEDMKDMKDMKDTDHSGHNH